MFSLCTTEKQGFLVFCVWWEIGALSRNWLITNTETSNYPANIYMIKCNNRNIKKQMTSIWCFFVNFEHFWHLYVRCVNVRWVSLLFQLAIKGYFMSLKQIYYPNLEINPRSCRQNIIKVSFKGTKAMHWLSSK